MSGTDQVAVKRCRKCGVEKPLTEFYKNARMKDGLSSACKPCVLAASRERYYDDVERHRGYKLNYYYRNKARKNRLHTEWQRRKVASDPVWHEQQKAKMRELNRIRRLDPAYLEADRARQRDYRRGKRAKEREALLQLASQLGDQPSVD